MPWLNFHSHTNFCDGSHPPEAYVQAAIEKGMKAYGFSGHGPLPFETPWNMKADDKLPYLHEIERLQKMYGSEIQLYKSIEADYLTGLVGPRDFDDWQLDYIICSIHFTGHLADGQPAEIDGNRTKFEEAARTSFGGDALKLMEGYYGLMRNMILQQTPDVLGHMDRPRKHNDAPGGLLFDEQSPIYQNAVMEVLEAAKQKEIIIEVNTKEVYRQGRPNPYPSPWILKEILKMGIPIMLNADTHRPMDVIGGFDIAAGQLYELGFRELMVFYNGDWQAKGFDRNGIYI